MNSSMLAELFQRAGVDNLWQEISKQASLKVYFVTDRDGTAASEAQSLLDQLMTLRNRVAHPTADTTFPDFEQLLRFIEFLRVLSGVLVSVLEIPLATFRSAEALAPSAQVPGGAAEPATA